MSPPRPVVPRRTLVLGILNLAFGAVFLVGSLAMLLDGINTLSHVDARASRGTAVALLGAARVLASLPLEISGVLLLRNAPRARTFALAFAVAWTALNVLEYALFREQFVGTVLVGTLYPAMLTALLGRSAPRSST